MKRNVMLLLILSLLYSCKDGAFERVELLSPQWLDGVGKEVSADVYMPSKMLVCGKRMVVLDNTKEDVFKVFSLPSLDYEYSFGKIGMGPDEFSVIDKESLNSDGEDLLFMDKMVMKTKNLSDPDSPIKIGRSVISETKETVNALKRLNDAVYVSNSSMDDLSSEFQLLDVGNRVVESCGVFPDWDSSLKTPVQKKMAYMKSICVNPKTGKKALFYYHYPVMRLYSSSNSLERQICFGNDCPHMINEEDKMIYFTESYATEDYIYVMFVGKSKKEVGTDLENFNPQILVLDWDGNLVGNFKLDQPVITFAVDGNKLYAFSFLDMDKCYVYDLPLDSDFVHISNGVLSFDMFSGYEVTDACRDDWSSFRLIEKDGYKKHTVYLWQSGQKKNEDLDLIALNADFPMKKDMDIVQYVDYLRNRKQEHPDYYREDPAVDCGGKTVFPIRRMDVSLNAEVNRVDSLYTIGYIFKDNEKSCFLTLLLSSNLNFEAIEENECEIRQIISSVTLN